MEGWKLVPLEMTETHEVAAIFTAAPIPGWGVTARVKRSGACSVPC
jgi:hypothetical protein